MSTGGAATRERPLRRARYLVPKTTPRRAEMIAAGGVVAVVAHLLFAQLTILLAVVFHAITRVSRWRPQWLALPAAAGVIWALAVGPASAAGGLLAGPEKILAYLGSVGGAPGRALHLGAAYTGLSGWLPRQLPLALITGAAEAALAAWLSWLHTDEWKLAPPRPGLVCALRRWYVARTVRLGGVVTRTGASLGVAAPRRWPGGTRTPSVTPWPPLAGGLWRQRGRAAVSWQEAAGGVLCAGAAGSGTTTTSFQLVHAAIRRRKPVIAVDLSGSRQLAEWFAIVCGATGTPLSVFSPSGGGSYEPLRDGDPARRAALVMGMIDWTGMAGQHRRSCSAYLHDLFAVTDAAPGDPGTAMLDELLHLLNPAALRARVQHVPGFHPHRQALTERVKVSAGLLEADPVIGATLAGQLGEFRASAFARWLAPGPAGAGAASAYVDLGRAVRQRGVVLFSLGDSAHSRPAAMMASLVAHDAMAICTELRRIGVAGDGLLWFDDCAALPAGVLAEMVRRGSAADMAAVLTTTSATVADKLADQVNTVVMHRMTDPAMAERFAWVTGCALVPGEAGAAVPHGPPRAGPAAGGVRAAPSGLAATAPGSPAYGTPGRAATTAIAGSPPPGGHTLTRRPAVPPEALFGLAKGEFVLVVKAPRPRLVPLGKTIPARLHVAPHRAVARAEPPSRPPARPPVARRKAAQAVPHPRQPLSNHGERPGMPGTQAGERLPAARTEPHPPHPPQPGGIPPAESPERRLWPR